MPRHANEAAAIIGRHIYFDPSANDGDADWQRLPELPTPDEILNPDATTDDLPWFPIEHVWQSKSEYLEALYRILRFEAIEGLRYSVNSVKTSPSMSDDENTCIYTRVRVKGYLFAKIGPLARISFSTFRAGAKIKWKQSKRLMPGKIVALSTDYFQNDCRIAVVAQRPIEGGLDQKPPLIDIIWADPHQASVDPDEELVMVESRNGYFEAVRHALTGLQHADGEQSPVDKYIVSGNRTDLPSASISASPNFNLSTLVDHLTESQLREAGGDKHQEQVAFQASEERFRACDIIKGIPPSLKASTNLDDSQLEALQRIVSKELAIVQGPPGTGKTYTSVKSIKVMLDNRMPGDPPIIISAQTNHALDQLLIYCHASKANIMRVGGRTDNEVIKERTVFELRNRSGKLPTKDYRSLTKEHDKIVGDFGNLVDGVFGGDGLLNPDRLLEEGIITQSQHESFMDDEWEANNDQPTMELWLAGEKIERVRQHYDDLDFAEDEAIDDSIELVELDANLDDDMAAGNDEEDDRIYGSWIPLSSQHTGQIPQIPHWEARCRALLEENERLFEIPKGYRGGVYQILQFKLRESAASRFRDLLSAATKLAKKTKANRWSRDLHVIDKHSIDIIGCTTTGLTKYRGFIAAMKPRILLIEEAAETREANITSALFPSIQQLILVGDHQQLPPSCDIARLASHPYNLNISLFERLVTNKIPYTMLDRQRRMAPELRFIVQKFYPTLKDHPIVTDIEQRPLVPGMGERRSWFFTHQWPEDTDADNSKFNQQETEMVVAFIRYLLHNGIKASEITVLTYYKGQKRRILQRLRRNDMPIGNFFNVATVDSYQGEENEIVILSLVRSPQPGRFPNVGFLDSRNRATVAISRARRGFFMFGNKSNLLEAHHDSFMTWAPVWNGFAEQQRVGMSKGLPLVCQNHKQEIWVRDADSFVGNAGGCWQKCTGKLPCGHGCALNCHNIPHEKLPCLQACTKSLVCGHKCAGYCTDPCRCAENCQSFNEAQVRLQMERMMLGIENEESSTTEDQPVTYAQMLATQQRQHSPERWQEFSQNPQVHDDAIRKVRLRDTDFDTTTTCLNQALQDNIKEIFVPVRNVDGSRIKGTRQNEDANKGLGPRTQSQLSVNRMHNIPSLPQPKVFTGNRQDSKPGTWSGRGGLTGSIAGNDSPRKPLQHGHLHAHASSDQPGHKYGTGGFKEHAYFPRHAPGADLNGAIRDRVAMQEELYADPYARGTTRNISASVARIGNSQGSQYGSADIEGNAWLPIVDDNVQDDSTIISTELGYEAEVCGNTQKSAAKKIRDVQRPKSDTAHQGPLIQRVDECERVELANSHDGQTAQYRKSTETSVSGEKKDEDLLIDI